MPSALDIIFLAASPKCRNIDPKNPRSFIERFCPSQHPADVHLFKLVQRNWIAQSHRFGFRRNIGRQKFQANSFALAQDGCALDYVSQLTNVAGPWISLQSSQRFVGKSNDSSAMV